MHGQVICNGGATQRPCSGVPQLWVAVLQQAYQVLRGQVVGDGAALQRGHGGVAPIWVAAAQSLHQRKLIRTPHNQVIPLARPPSRRENSSGLSHDHIPSEAAEAGWPWRGSPAWLTPRPVPPRPDRKST